MADAAVVPMPAAAAPAAAVAAGGGADQRRPLGAGAVAAGDLEGQGRAAAAAQDGGVLSLLTCRRRAPPRTSPQAAAAASADAGSSAAYQRLLARGRGLPEEHRSAYAKMAWWSEAVTGRGARTFVLVPRGMDGDVEGTVDMWELLSYAVSEMHEHVVERGAAYAAVWVQAGDHRLWSFSAWSFRRSLHQRYFDNVESVHVVHPSWMVRIYEMALWGVVKEDFWDRFFTHERLEFLQRYFDMEKLGLPPDVADYDAFLEDQTAFMSEQAAMYAGGSLNLPSDVAGAGGALGEPAS